MNFSFGKMVAYIVGAVVMFCVGYAVVTRIPPLMRILTPTSQ